MARVVGDGGPKAEATEEMDEAVESAGRAGGNGYSNRALGPVLVAKGVPMKSEL